MGCASNFRRIALEAKDRFKLHTPIERLVVCMATEAEIEDRWGVSLVNDAKFWHSPGPGLGHTLGDHSPNKLNPNAEKNILTRFEDSDGDRVASAFIGYLQLNEAREQFLATYHDEMLTWTKDTFTQEIHTDNGVCGIGYANATGERFLCDNALFVYRRDKNTGQWCEVTGYPTHKKGDITI